MGIALFIRGKGAEILGLILFIDVTLWSLHSRNGVFLRFQGIVHLWILLRDLYRFCIITLSTVTERETSRNSRENCTEA